MAKENEQAGTTQGEAPSERGANEGPSRRLATDGGFDAGFFEQVVDEVGVGVGVYDDTGRFTYVNDAYAALLDVPVDELVGSPIWAVNPEVDEERFQDYWASFDTGETRRTTTVHERADGSQIPVETHTTVIDVNGDRYHVGTITDISKRVEGWRELERQDERLEQFASVMSHDLRNPLNVAMGRLRLVKEDCDSEHIDPVENALERMEELIDNVLTLAREGSRLTEPTRVSLREAATTAWATSQEESASLDVGDDLGAVESDESRLCEIFENLFRNAVEHGGSDVTVCVGKLDDGFYVEDDGDGIDPDTRDDIFEFGFSTSADGTGFGLAIVEEIADAHGWTVTVTESEAGGARFEFHGVEIE